MARGRHLNPRIARRLGLEQPRHIFFQHQMKVGAAEAIGADRRSSWHAARRHFPRPRFVQQRERHVGKVNVRVGALAVECRRQNLFVQGEDGFEQARRASPGLQVADVAFGGTQPNAPALGPPKDFMQAFGLGRVTDRRAGAVRFNQRTRRGVKTSIVPGPLNRVDLTDRVGGGDALALTVGRSAHAANHRIDRIAVALGVGQPFEQERR